VEQAAWGEPAYGPILVCSVTKIMQMNSMVWLHEPLEGEPELVAVPDHEVGLYLPQALYPRVTQAW